MRIPELLKEVISRKKIFIIFILLGSLTSGKLFSQTEQTPPIARKSVGYFSFIIPIVTYQGNTFTPNFKSSTTIGFPFRVNVLYSDKFGFSFEITPSINFQQPSGKGVASKNQQCVI